MRDDYTKPVIESVDATYVYVSAGGLICINQPDAFGEPVVAFHARDAEGIIKAIETAKREIEGGGN